MAVNAHIDRCFPPPECVTSGETAFVVECHQASTPWPGGCVERRSSSCRPSLDRPMPVTPYSAGASRRVHPAPTTPAAKPRRLLSATQTPPSQKTPQRLLMASSPYNTSPYNTPVRYTPPGASTCACWHGKQPPPWRVAWRPPSPYLEDLTKTLVIAPPVRRIPLTLTVTLNLHPQPSPSIPTTHLSP